MILKEYFTAPKSNHEFEQARSNMVLNQLRANRIRDIDLIEKLKTFLEMIYSQRFKASILF